MPSDVVKDIENGVLRDLNGSPIRKINTKDGKCYAVIVKCGHAGDGYFIPIMMTTKSEDVKSAIEYVVATSKVQRGRKDTVLDAFEITPRERFFIESINDHDGYLRGYYTKKSEELRERRVFHGKKFLLKNKSERDSEVTDIKTAEMYGDYDVLQKAVAPFYNGDKLIYPKKINRKELLHEFFKQATIRYGIKRGDSFFPVLYYQMYGKENDLNIQYIDSGYMTYRNDGRWITSEIPDSIYGNVKDILDNISKETNKKEEEDWSKNDVSISSQTERFNRRYQKFLETKKDDPTGSQPGEE